LTTISDKLLKLEQHARLKIAQMNYENSQEQIQFCTCLLRRAFFRPLFCHSSIAKYTSSLLQKPKALGDLTTKCHGN